MNICKENLNETIQNLESLVGEHEKAFKDHPHVMGYDEGFYSHGERAKDYQQLLGYLRELDRYRRGELK